MNSEFVAVEYKHLLTGYELKQIKQYKKIYYVGHNAKRNEKMQLCQANLDNEEYEY